MRVEGLGFSIVTDMCLPDALEPGASKRLSPLPRGRGQVADGRPVVSGTARRVTPRRTRRTQGGSGLAFAGKRPSCPTPVMAPTKVGATALDQCPLTAKPYKETLNLPVTAVRHEGEPDGP